MTTLFACGCTETKITDESKVCSNSVTYSSEPLNTNEQVVDVGGGITFVMVRAETVTMSGIKVRLRVNSNTTVKISVFQGHNGGILYPDPDPAYEFNTVLSPTSSFDGEYFEINFPQPFVAAPLDEYHEWAVALTVVSGGLISVYEGYLEESPHLEKYYSRSYDGSAWTSSSNSVAAGLKLATTCP